MASDEEVVGTDKASMVWGGREGIVAYQAETAIRKERNCEEGEPPPYSSELVQCSQGTEWERKQRVLFTGGDSVVENKAHMSNSLRLAIRSECGHVPRPENAEGPYGQWWTKNEMGAEVKNAENLETIMKQMKAEERRARNHVSAQQSNERKRAVKSALEKELNKERLRVCELRMSEKILQEENLRMQAGVKSLVERGGREYE